MLRSCVFFGPNLEVRSEVLCKIKFAGFFTIFCMVDEDRPGGGSVRIYAVGEIYETVSLI